MLVLAEMIWDASAMTTVPSEPLAPLDEPLLDFVRVEELFGRYTYEVKAPEDGRLVLIHGENGSGKTTLLRLIWNLLSPADNRGHRSNLSKTPFRLLTVGFRDGTVISAEKQSGLLGTFTVRVNQRRADDIIALYEADASYTVPRSRGRAVSEGRVVVWRELVEDEWRHQPGLLPESLADSELGQPAYHRFLRAREINPLLLADDRSLYSDDEDLERVREGVIESARDVAFLAPTVGESVGRELSITLRRANELLRTLTLRGQNLGSVGANAIYKDVLERLAAAGPDDKTLPSHGQDYAVEHLLRDLEARSPRFEEFDLVPRFEAADYRSLLHSVRQDRRDLAQGILMPYLDSLAARYNALEEAERVLRSLLTLINGFFTHKTMQFSPRNGLRIMTTEGDEIEAALLSSGERQLTMLLCTTLLAARGSRLFIIDEPELSLGVKWQRTILDALLELTRDSNLQFLVATHSIEVVSTHPEALVPLIRD